MLNSFSILKSLLLAVLLISQSPQAQAGPGGTGGGRSVVCRNSKGQIKSAELLDLWEARTLYSRKIVESRSTVSTQVAGATNGLQNAFYFDGTSEGEISSGEHFRLSIRKTIELFLKPSPQVRRLRNIKLSDTPDSNEPAVPATCRVEQVVSFLDAPATPVVLINQDIFEKLSPTNQAALIVHEALYTFLRQYWETNSVRARRAVGHVFAGGTFPNRDGWLRARHIDCEAVAPPYSVISIYTKPDQTLGLIQRIDQNALMIGLYEPAAKTLLQLTKDFEGSLDFLLSDQSCRHIPGEQSNTYSFYWIPGQGPADFQRETILAARCDQGRAKFQLGGGTRPAQPLKCKMVEAHKKF